MSDRLPLLPRIYVSRQPRKMMMGHNDNNNAVWLCWPIPLSHRIARHSHAAAVCGTQSSFFSVISPFCFSFIFHTFGCQSLNARVTPVVASMAIVTVALRTLRVNEFPHFRPTNVLKTPRNCCLCLLPLFGCRCVAAEFAVFSMIMCMVCLPMPVNQCIYSDERHSSPSDVFASPTKKRPDNIVLVVKPERPADAVTIRRAVSHPTRDHLSNAIRNRSNCNSKWRMWRGSLQSFGTQCSGTSASHTVHTFNKFTHIPHVVHTNDIGCRYKIIYTYIVCIVC